MCIISIPNPSEKEDSPHQHYDDCENGENGSKTSLLGRGSNPPASPQHVSSPAPAQYTERIGQVNSLLLKTDCNEVYGLMKIKCFEMFAHQYMENIAQVICKHSDGDEVVGLNVIVDQRF